MSNRPVRYVSASCQCGASFDREVKRGRPQVWCPDCLAVPFYERQRVAAAPGEVVSTAAKNQWDRFAHVRPQIEAEVVQVNVEHKARFAALVAEGQDPWEIAPAMATRLGDELRSVYAKYSAGVVHTVETVETP